jgi:integrase
MRRGAALGLRWSDLDLDAARLRVVQTLIQTRGNVTIGEPKTAHRRRPLALDKGTVAVMHEHRRRMLEERLLVRSDFDDHGLVFHHPDGTCLRPDAVSEMFLRQARRYGLPRLTLQRPSPHLGDARMERGIHPRVVQERFGHSSISITLGMYSHVGPILHD